MGGAPIVSLDPDQFRETIRGVIPVQFCPYTDEGEIDFEGLRKNTEYLVDFATREGADFNILTNGSGTEFYANTIEEQQKVIQTVVDTVDGEIPVIAGVSQAGTRKTADMARFAQEAGADALMMVMPYYNSPTQSGMYKHFSYVAERVDAPFMIYNNPHVAGTLLPPSFVKKLSKVDNIVAIKDNCTIDGNISTLSRIIDPEDMTLITGKGEGIFISSHASGANHVGFVSTPANYAPEWSYRIYEAVMDGDYEEAFDVYSQLARISDLTAEFDAERGSFSVMSETAYGRPQMGLAVGKTAMDLKGLNGGSVRLPMENLTDDEEQQVEELLVDIGIL